VTVVDSDDDASIKTVQKAKSHASYKRQKENGGYEGDSDDVEYLSSITNEINKVRLPCYRTTIAKQRSADPA
jgi:hypothetical protein